MNTDTCEIVVKKEISRQQLVSDSLGSGDVETSNKETYNKSAR